jgi:PAS domain-containing protein
MTGKRPRYRFILVEEPAETLPVRYRRRRSPPFMVRRTDPMEVLLEAFLRLSWRSEGSAAWAPVLSENPLTFLLDAVGDAVVVRHSDGRLAYANPAARRLAWDALDETAEPLTSLEVLEVGGRRFERRCMPFGQGPRSLILEVLRRLEE